MSRAEHVARDRARTPPCRTTAPKRRLRSSRLDRLEQVVGVVRDLGVAVAGQAEQRRAATTSISGNSQRQKMGDHGSRAGSAARESPIATKRARPSGTLTRANRSSPDSGSRTSGAEAEGQPRDVRERLSWPDGERRQDRVDLAREDVPRARRARPPSRLRRRRRGSLRRPAQGRGRRATASTARRQLEHAARGPRRAPAAASGRRASARRGRRATWSSSPATLTMKNSSRIDETIPQNLTRSSSGSLGSAASSSTRRIRSTCDSSRLRSVA